jgi:ABC-type nitrate/sulfonate/bicarbonate transport system permease component
MVGIILLITTVLFLAFIVQVLSNIREALRSIDRSIAELAKTIRTAKPI